MAWLQSVKEGMAVTGLGRQIKLLSELPLQPVNLVVLILEFAETSTYGRLQRSNLAAGKFTRNKSSAGEASAV